MRVVRPLLLAISIAVAATSTRAEPHAVAYGTTTTAPVATSAASPQRRALIIGSSALTGSAPARVAVGEADAARYRDLLRLLGFTVTTVFAETRPELDLGVRGFAKTISPATEVAVFVLGTVLPRDDDLFLIASDARPAPARYAIDGLRLGDLMAAIAGRGARETVLFVDECHDAAGQVCRVGARTVPDAVSAIVGARVAPNGSGTPMAGLASLGGEMMPLMRREGLTYLDLYPALKERLVSSNMTVATSPSLTRGFAFLPADFLSRLSVPCNDLDGGASAETLRTAASVAPLVAACAKAAATWSFRPWFEDKLAVAREQDLFQKAASGCDDARARAYRAAYPGGRYIGALDGIATACEQARRPQAPPPQPPPEDTSQATCTVGGLDPAGNNWLALRDRPSFQSSWSPTRMGPGTVVTALGRDGLWIRVRLASGETGWANSRFLGCGAVPPAPRAANLCEVYGLDPSGNNWLALRDRPSFQSSWSSTKMGPGTRLAVIGRSGDWLRVRLGGGETGWANGRFVRCEQ